MYFATFDKGNTWWPVASLVKTDPFPGLSVTGGVRESYEVSVEVSVDADTLDDVRRTQGLMRGEFFLVANRPLKTDEDRVEARTLHGPDLGMRMFRVVKMSYQTENFSNRYRVTVRVDGIGSVVP